jgi:hypothetical protein
MRAICALVVPPVVLRTAEIAWATSVSERLEGSGYGLFLDTLRHLHGRTVLSPSSIK